MAIPFAGEIKMIICQVQCVSHFKSNHFIGLRSSKDYSKRRGGVVGVYGKGHLAVSFLRGSVCAEEMRCEMRWVRLVLRGTGTASGHPGVPGRISPRMR